MTLVEGYVDRLKSIPSKFFSIFQEPEREIPDNIGVLPSGTNEFFLQFAGLEYRDFESETFFKVTTEEGCSGGTCVELVFNHNPGRELYRNRRFTHVHIRADDSIPLYPGGYAFRYLEDGTSIRGSCSSEYLRDEVEFLKGFAKGVELEMLPRNFMRGVTGKLFPDEPDPRFLLSSSI